MAENASNSPFIDKKSNQLILAHLLKKKRDPKNTELVAQIANSPIKEEEKIKRILKIDAYIISATELKKEKVLQDKSNRNLLTDLQIITESQAALNRTKLKIIPRKTPWLFFIFKRQPELKAFKHSTMVINYTRFPPSIKIERGVRAFLIYTVQNEAITLLGIIPGILRFGWKYLDKHDYNLLVLFKRLLDMIAFTDFINIKYTGNISSDFTDIENLFLSCHFKPGYPEKIIYGIDIVCQKVPNLQKRRVRAVELTRRVLYPEGDRLSLFHIIRGINMVECRCYVELSSLINRSLEDVVSNFDFQCDQEIQDNISQYIKERLIEVQKMRNTLEEVNKNKKFIWDYKNDDMLEGYDLRLLRTFYESDRTNKREFEHDKKDIAYFGSVFFPRFLEEFEAFLSKTIKLKDYGSINVFHKTLFQKELDKIRELLSRYNKQIFIVPHMGYQNFKAIRQGEVTGNTPEMMSFKYLDELSTVLVNIGKKLANVYVYRKEESNPNEAIITPIENEMLSNKKIIMPYWNSFIIDDGFIGGKKFYEVLRIIISICFLIGIYFQDRNITNIMEKGIDTGYKIDQKALEIKKFADIITYQDIKNKYNLNP